MKTLLILLLTPSLLLAQMPNTMPSAPQEDAFLNHLKTITPKDESQKVIAATATERQNYYVTISGDSQTGVAVLYAQSPDGAVRLIGSDEDIDSLINRGTPTEEAQALITQLAARDIRRQGAQKIEAQLQSLVDSYGARGLDYISKQRLQAYRALGLQIPSPQ